MIAADCRVHYNETIFEKDNDFCLFSTAAHPIEATVEGTQDVDVWAALQQSIGFYDVLCIVPVYLAVRSLMGKSFRNLWLLLLAQFSIILYIFLSGSFVINAQLVSFSMLLIPISTDAYKGVIQWKKVRILDRLDGIAHLTTAIMLIYHHPYEGSDQDHRGYIIASVVVGFLLGKTALLQKTSS